VWAGEAMAVKLQVRLLVRTLSVAVRLAALLARTYSGQVRCAAFVYFMLTCENIPTGPASATRSADGADQHNIDREFD
jgi:hypothetical protein